MVKEFWESPYFHQPLLTSANNSFFINESEFRLGDFIRMPPHTQSVFCLQSLYFEDNVLHANVREYRTRAQSLPSSSRPADAYDNEVYATDTCKSVVVTSSFTKVRVVSGNVVVPNPQPPNQFIVRFQYSPAGVYTTHKIPQFLFQFTFRRESTYFCLAFFQDAFIVRTSCPNSIKVVQFRILNQSIREQRLAENKNVVAYCMCTCSVSLCMNIMCLRYSA